MRCCNSFVLPPGCKQLIGGAIFLFTVILCLMAMVFWVSLACYGPVREPSEQRELQELSYSVCDEYGCGKAEKQLHWAQVYEAWRFWESGGPKKIQELHPPKEGKK